MTDDEHARYWAIWEGTPDDIAGLWATVETKALAEQVRAAMLRCGLNAYITPETGPIVPLGRSEEP